jgi:thiamine pyrophosphate-dependent acetolactate synthase large subunit-like protein
MATGAQSIVAGLEEAGVEVVFGLPGVHNLALWEALRTSSIRLVGVRHEQAAAYAADGYARAAGRTGVALTTTGPGAANTLAAVGEAWTSRSDVLVIATDIPAALRRPGTYRGVLHETRDQAAMFDPVVDDRLTGAESIAAALRSSARVRYLQVPTDQLNAECTPLAYEAERLVRRADVPEIRAQRPLVWVGGPLDRRRHDVVALAESLGAPVIETYQGRGTMPVGHPLRVGFPPHVPPVGALWDHADVVVVIDDPLEGMTTQNWLQPQPPRLLAIGRPTPNYEHEEVAWVRGDGDLWVDLPSVRRRVCEQLDEAALEFLDAVAYALPEEAVVACDMCIPGYWVAGFHPFPAPRRLLYPVGWGTLGFAFPAALGAALASTGPVVSLSGDGGFLFACGELATMAQERLPLTAVVVDDAGYGMLRYDQEQAGLEPFGVDLRSPDFAALARSFGVRAQTVNGLGDEFGEALARHVADPQPSVLVARADALTPPPTTSPNWYRR